MRSLILLLPITFLCGCSTLIASSKNYNAVIYDITNQKQLDDDKTKCHNLADNYNPGLSAASVAQGTAEGAASNTSMAVINPLVPVAGALGGGATAVISGFGLNGADSIKIYVQCLREESHADHAYKVADPH